MNSPKSDDDRLAYHVGGLNLSGLTMTKVILWLAAITIVSFAIGFGLLALSGGLPQPHALRDTPFQDTHLLTRNTTTILLDGASSGSIRISMGAGEFTLGGGAPAFSLMEATVFSSAAEWQPEILASVNGTEKTVTMIEPGHQGREWFAFHTPYSWHIQINDLVPVDLKVEVGAGDSNLDLGSLNLTSLVVSNGVGDTDIDISRSRSGPFRAEVHNGVGDLTVRIDKRSNTRISVHSGVGNISTIGIVKNNNTYTTVGFNPSLPVSEIAITQGVGSIQLEAV